MAESNLAEDAACQPRLTVPAAAPPTAVPGFANATDIRQAFLQAMRDHHAPENVEVHSPHGGGTQPNQPPTTGSDEGGSTPNGLDPQLIEIQPHENLPRSPGFPSFLAAAPRTGVRDCPTSDTVTHQPSSQTDHDPASATTHPCLETFISLCGPWSLPEPWECLTTDPWAIRGPSDPAAALAEMISRHGEQSVIDSKLAVKNDAGQVVLQPLLAQPDAGFVVVRDSVTRAYRDLITNAGCVISPHPPILEVLADKQAQDAFHRQQRRVLLTATLVDAVVLRALGLAAVPIVGLDNLSSQYVEYLGQYYGVTRDPSAREREEAEDQCDDDGHPRCSETAGTPQNPPSSFNSSPTCAHPSYFLPMSGHVGFEDGNHLPLVLVNWSVHQLSREDPAATNQAICFLHKLATYRGLDISEVSSWKPSAAELGAIHFGLARGERGWAQDALRDSLYSSSHMLQLAKTSSAASASLCDLEFSRKNLYRQLCGEPARFDRQQQVSASLNYIKVAIEQLSGPILRRAKTTEDPLEVSLCTQFVELYSLFVSQATLASEQALRGLSQGLDQQHAQQVIKNVTTLSSKLVSVAKELGKCKTSTHLPPRNPKIQSPIELSQRFGNWDLMQQN
jgi:hypothetical protein